MYNELYVSKSGASHLSLCTNLLNMYGLLLWTLIEWVDVITKGLSMTDFAFKSLASEILTVLAKVKLLMFDSCN